MHLKPSVELSIPPKNPSNAPIIGKITPKGVTFQILFLSLPREEHLTNTLLRTLETQLII